LFRFSLGRWPFLGYFRFSSNDGAILARVVKPSEPVPEIEHYANGKVKLKGSRLDGDLHGAWEWFRTDGSLMRTGRLDRGKQTGMWRTFDRTGRMVKETDFG
jgi:hypothetical protein